MERPIRLFDTETQKFTDGSHPYAILSHRWVKNEPTFRQVHRRQYLPPTNSKFKRFCDVAGERYQCRYVWVDSICINKHDKKELDSSIQSMFSWYQNAEICIVYLQDASDLNDIWSSAWFTRGWTLQELLAPQKIAFFFGDWTRILPKSDIDINRGQSELISTGTESAFHKKVALAAGIPESTLASTYIPSPRNLEQVLKWAEKRKTTVPEDSAYSLVSLLGICLPPRYRIGSAAALSELQRTVNDACLAQISSRSLRFSIESTSGDKTALCEKHRISSGDPVIVRMSGQGDAMELLKVLPERHLVFTSPPGLLKPSRSANGQYAIYKELEHNSKSSRPDGQAPFVIVDESANPPRVIASRVEWCHECCCDEGACRHDWYISRIEPTAVEAPRFRSFDQALRIQRSKSKVQSMTRYRAQGGQHGSGEVEIEFGEGERRNMAKEIGQDWRKLARRM